MNLIAGVLINLWVAGWIVAAVRAGLKERAGAAPLEITAAAKSAG